MNPFDAIVYAALLIAVVLGFRSGFLRSMATILGYIAAVIDRLKQQHGLRRRPHRALNLSLTTRDQWAWR